jgi:hypothetical protein
LRFAAVLVTQRQLRSAHLKLRFHAADRALTFGQLLQHLLDSDLSSLGLTPT